MDEPSEKKRVFYNLEMAKALRQVMCPVKDLVMDIKMRPNYVALVVYESNIMMYDETRRGDIMEYLLMCRNVIQSYGTRCEIEGAKGAPKSLSNR